MSADKQMISVGSGVDLAVRNSGRGRIPVVFLHGYSLSAETWDRVLPFFSEGTFTRISYDLRGFGDSSKPENGYTMHQHALDLHALLDRLGLEKAVLIGHSLGGAIIQRLATLHPERVLAFVSCDAFAQFNTLPGMDEAKRRRADSFGTREQNRAVLESAVARYFDPRNAERESIELFVGIALKASSAALRDQLMDAYCAPSVDVTKYEALRMPVMALSGATDVVAPVQQAIDLSDRVPESELAVIPRTGHTPMWEAPEAWARLVLDFLHRRVATANA
jgi:pimeloyl-ACP methyl ester carboxylesterase